MSSIIPILRVFDYAKTVQFYVDWLRCTVVFEHREENVPFYMRARLQEVEIDLSEHHGDCSPGAKIYMKGFKDLRKFHREILLGANYTYMRPGIHRAPFDETSIEVTLIDPFYNRIVLSEVVGLDVAAEVEAENST